jgi:hypothetical protein
MHLDDSVRQQNCRRPQALSLWRIDDLHFLKVIASHHTSEFSPREAFEVVSTNFLKDQGSNDLKSWNAANALSLRQEMKVECESIELRNNGEMLNRQFD